MNQETKLKAQLLRTIRLSIVAGVSVAFLGMVITLAITQDPGMLPIGGAVGFIVGSQAIRRYLASKERKNRGGPDAQRR